MDGLPDGPSMDIGNNRISNDTNIQTKKWVGKIIWTNTITLASPARPSARCRRPGWASFPSAAPARSACSRQWLRPSWLAPSARWCLFPPAAAIQPCGYFRLRLFPSWLLLYAIISSEHLYGIDGRVMALSWGSWALMYKLALFLNGLTAFVPENGQMHLSQYIQHMAHAPSQSQVSSLCIMPVC